MLGTHLNSSVPLQVKGRTLSPTTSAFLDSELDICKYAYNTHALMLCFYKQFFSKQKNNLLKHWRLLRIIGNVVFPYQRRMNVYEVLREALRWIWVSREGNFIPATGHLGPRCRSGAFLSVKRPRVSKGLAKVCKFLTQVLTAITQIIYAQLETKVAWLVEQHWTIKPLIHAAVARSAPLWLVN